MPRVKTVKKNRAGAVRFCGRCRAEILPGDTYYRWSFRYGGTHYRCQAHRPRPSELTQSLMSGVYAAQEHASDQMAAAETVEDVKALVEEVATACEEVMEQYRDAAEPFGGAGENAERADELEGWHGELEGFYPNEPDDDDDDEAKADAVEAARNEAQELIDGCPL